MRYKRGKEGDGRKALVERERRCSEPLECTSTRKAGWDNLKFFGAVSPALFLPASSFTPLTHFVPSLSLLWAPRCLSSLLVHAAPTTNKYVACWGLFGAELVGEPISRSRRRSVATVAWAQWLMAFVRRTHRAP